MQRNIVVIGASAGGIEALTELLALLPADFAAAIFVVIHSSPDSPGMLPRILGRSSTLEAVYAKDGAAILPGHVYVAPADRHLLLEQGRMRLTHGPKENRFRPAIDPLFRSAAYAYGPEVIGIILSGSLDDGTAGLWAIKDRGGLAVVQEPDEAAYPSMPLHALKYVHVDYRFTIAEMGKLLPHLVGEPLAAPIGTPVATPVVTPMATEERRSMSTNSRGPGTPDHIEIETKIALEHNPLDAGVMQLGPLTPFTCPECSGVLVQLQEGNLLRFRCHTGHAFTVDSLLEGINESIENTLWSTVRALEEHMLLLRHLARHAEERTPAHAGEHTGEGAGEHNGEHTDRELARRLSFKAQTAEDKVQIVRQLALRQSSEESGV